MAAFDKTKQVVWRSSCYSGNARVHNIEASVQVQAIADRVLLTGRQPDGHEITARRRMKQRRDLREGWLTGRIGFGMFCGALTVN